MMPRFGFLNPSSARLNDPILLLLPPAADHLEVKGKPCLQNSPPRNRDGAMKLRFEGGPRHSTSWHGQKCKKLLHPPIFSQAFKVSGPAQCS